MAKKKTLTKAEIAAAEAAEAERLARIERDRIDALEMDQLDAHVNINLMTRDQMAAFAMRTYGVRVDASVLKADVTSAVRSIMVARSGGRYA